MIKKIANYLRSRATSAHLSSILLGAIGVCILIGVGGFLTGMYGEASSESNLAYKIGSYLIALTVIATTLGLCVKYVAPNTIGKDIGDTFDKIWEGKLSATHKFWAMLVTLLVVFHELVKLFIHS